VEYLLTPSVDQQADPTALPDMSPGSAFEQALISAAKSVVRQQIRDAFNKN